MRRAKEAKFISRCCCKHSCSSLTVLCILSHSAGDSWYHIPSPSKQKLKQVSVGRTSLYAVDENGKASLYLYLTSVQTFILDK